MQARPGRGVLALIRSGVVTVVVVAMSGCGGWKWDPEATERPDFSTLERAPPPGCFDFKGGSMQAWTLDQLYDASSDPPAKIQTVIPGTPPTYLTYTPFVLQNRQSIALEATTGFYLVADSSVKDADIYLESPDLSKEANWQGRGGYELDVRREFTSYTGNYPKRFWAQLQARVIDTTDGGKVKLFVETQGPTNAFHFHEVALETPTHLSFKAPFFADSKYILKSVRVRFRMPAYRGPGSGEDPYKGAWVIGNVCPLRP